MLSYKCSFKVSNYMNENKQLYIPNVTFEQLIGILSNTINKVRSPNSDWYTIGFNVQPD